METLATILITLAVAVGLRDIVPFIVRWLFNRNQSKLDLENAVLTNTDKKIKNLQDATNVNEELVRKFEAQLEIIVALKEDKVLDKQKLDHRDGVIDYQKKELASLHQEIIMLRANETRASERIAQLEARVSELEKQNKELVGLKDINSTLLNQNMAAKAILRKLKDEGVWKGDEEVIFNVQP